MWIPECTRKFTRTFFKLMINSKYLMQRCSNLNIANVTDSMYTRIMINTTYMEKIIQVTIIPTTNMK